MNEILDNDKHQVTGEQEVKVLVVEDSRSVGELIKSTLETYHMHVSLIDRSSLVIENALTLNPQVILLDVFLDGASGFDLCRELKQSEVTKDIPVLFLTGLSDPEHRALGFEVGGADYIVKPFDETDLVARVRVHVQNRVLIRELADKMEQLERVNQLLAQLIKASSHDLRSPIASITQLAAIYLEQDVSDPDKLRQFYERLVSSGTQMLALVEELISASNDAETIVSKELIFEPVKTGDLIQNTFSLFALLARQKNVSLVVGDDSRDLVIVCDENHMRHVVNNLVSNAIKFTESGGSVTVSSRNVTEDGVKGVEISVLDTGIGMPEGSYEQRDLGGVSCRPGTWNEYGTGLGLGIVKQAVEIHKGRLKAQSDDEGTLFTVFVPEIQDVDA